MSIRVWYGPVVLSTVARNVKVLEVFRARSLNVTMGVPPESSIVVGTAPPVLASELAT